MPFVWLLDRPAAGLAFKAPGSCSETRQDDAQLFATEEEAQAAFDAAKNAILAKRAAREKKIALDAAANPPAPAPLPTGRFGQSFRRFDPLLSQFNRKLNRLGAATLFEAAKPQPQLKTLWAVVAEDGQWLQMRSGMCALTTQPDSAAFFDSLQGARETARDGAWTKASEALSATANVVELEVRIKSAKAVFPVRRGSTGVNAFAGAWIAEQERGELAAAVQACEPKKKKAKSGDAPKIGATGRGDDPAPQGDAASAAGSPSGSGSKSDMESTAPGEASSGKNSARRL